LSFVAAQTAHHQHYSCGYINHITEGFKVATIEFDVAGCYSPHATEGSFFELADGFVV
jgi:hypothetical protein